MASKLDICNDALTLLGKQPITDINENSEAARRCNALFDSTRDEVLRAFPWQFAKRIIALTLTTKTTLGWAYVYAYPAACLNVRRVIDEATFDSVEPPNFDMMDIDNATVIVSNLPDAYAEYTGQINDPTKFDAQFSKALGARLASYLAMPLTVSESKRNDCLKMFYQLISEAQTSSANERKEETKYKRTYADVR